MSLKKIIPPVVIIVVGLALFSYCLTAETFALGHDPNNIGRAFIVPSSPLYSLKVIKENIERKFATTENSRLKRELEYSSRRIREVKGLIDDKHEEYILSTLERYRDHLKTLEGMSGDDKQARRDVIENVMHQPDLLMELYKQTHTKDGRRGIRSAIERVQKYLWGIDEFKVSIDKQISICEFLNDELVSDLLNDSEKVILEEIVLECMEKMPETDIQKHAGQ